MLIFFAFDIDDMESSKGRVTVLSLIFLLKCISKSIVIGNIVCSFLVSLLLIVRFQYITIFQSLANV